MLKAFCIAGTLVFFLFLVACQSDDAPVAELKFTKDQLQTLHGESGRTWKVSVVYENYSQTEFSRFNNCYKDDLYTFSSDTTAVEVSLGSVRCFWPDATAESATVNYMYDEQSGRVFLEHGRAEQNGGFFYSHFFVMELVELSENRVFFASGENGRYSKAIVFEPSSP
jgi:hypothetical protein